MLKSSLAGNRVRLVPAISEFGSHCCRGWLNGFYGSSNNGDPGPTRPLDLETEWGASGRRTPGNRAAKGKYIALLDGDDVWFQDYATRHVSALERDPSLGISCSFVAYIDEQGETHRPVRHNSHFGRPTTKQLIARNSISSHVVVRRECFAQAGLFDENVAGVRGPTRCGSEYFTVLNTEPVFCHEVLIGYRVRSTSLMMNFDHQIKNAHAVIEKFESEIGISRLLKRRSLAEHYRIASRQALSSGQRHKAARFLRTALRYCPWLPLCDLRAMGTLLLVGAECSLPACMRRAPYRAALGAMRLFYRWSIGRSKTLCS